MPFDDVLLETPFVRVPVADEAIDEALDVVAGAVVLIEVARVVAILTWAVDVDVTVATHHDVGRNVRNVRRVSKNSIVERVNILILVKECIVAE
jgi:hypothetical protein